MFSERPESDSLSTTNLFHAIYIEESRSA